MQVLYILVYRSTRYNRVRESPHAVFALQSGVGFATAILPAVRDRFWNGKPEFTWSDIQALVSTYGSVTDGGRPSST